MSDMINPGKSFLKHCTEPLEGVCRYDVYIIIVSGVFGQYVPIVENLAK